MVGDEFFIFIDEPLVFLSLFLDVDVVGNDSCIKFFTVNFVCGIVVEIVDISGRERIWNIFLDQSFVVMQNLSRICGEY